MTNPTTAPSREEMLSNMGRVKRHIPYDVWAAIVALIESGIETREQERKRFFQLTDELAQSRGVADQKRLKEELARMTFGE